MVSTHTIYFRIAAFIAVIHNILLILLIIFKSHRKVGKYKILMIYISIFEIVYAILDALGAPTIFTKDSMFVVVIYNDQTLAPKIFSELFCECFCVFFGISMALFAIHFIYRFLVVSEHKILNKYNNHVIIILLVFPLVFGLFWLWIVKYFIPPFDMADQFLVKNHLNSIGVNITDVRYAGVFFWPPGPDGHYHIHWKSSIGIFIMIVASVAIIFVFGYKCYVETSKVMDNASQSPSFKKLQSQLFYALVFQTAIPVILMHIPASIGFTASFFNLSIEILGDISSSTICLYPVLDPLPNFFIIKNYREAISKVLRTFKRRVLCIEGATVDIDMVSEFPSVSQNVFQAIQS